MRDLMMKLNGVDVLKRLIELNTNKKRLFEQVDKKKLLFPAKFSTHRQLCVDQLLHERFASVASAWRAFAISFHKCCMSQVC